MTVKTVSGHEFVVAWNKERRDVVLALDSDSSAIIADSAWIRLTPAEARDIALELTMMADAAERDRSGAAYVPGIDEAGSGVYPGEAFQTMTS